MHNLDTLLAGLRAAGEHTRLRILALCAHSELSVGELTRILGQSQPRVSRHLKLMLEAGLLERFPEGAQVFYRLSDRAAASKLAHALVDLLQDDDPALARDFSRLKQITDARAEQAQTYFQSVAREWNDIRALHVPEEELETALRRVVGPAPVDDLIDIGTGTGKILEVLADLTRQGIGVDLSTGMLSVARTNIERAGHKHLQVRKADMYRLPMNAASFDLAILHLVLHYCDDPAEAVKEAARVLKPAGRVIIVDFAAHTLEQLRAEYQHRRLGFSDAEILRYFQNAQLEATETVQLIHDPLTVKIWCATRYRD